MMYAACLPLDLRSFTISNRIRAAAVTVVLAVLMVSPVVAGDRGSQMEQELVRPTNVTAEAWEKIVEQVPLPGLKSFPETTEALKIFPSTPGASASFGWSTAADGDTVVVGAYGFVSYTGVAYVFERNQGGPDNWGEVKKILASDYSSYSRFGRSVGISGDTVVIGAIGEGSGGAAYIYQRNHGGADNWGEVAKVTGSDQTSSASFGGSIAISNDFMVVGASGQSASSGAAYLFGRNQGGADTWGQIAKLTASVAGTLQFGVAVGISGETVVTGAQNGDLAFVFERNQGGADSWGEAAVLSASDGTAGDQFGGSVGISRDTVVVGAEWAENGGTNRGAAYVYERNEGGADSWGEVAILAALDATDQNHLGCRVAIDDDVVAAAATALDDQGVVYLFDRNEGGADSWGQVARLAAADGAELEFGVAVSGATLVLGAAADGTQGFGAGAAFIFRRSGETWAQAQKMDADDTLQGDGFAFSLAMDGDVAVIGAWPAAEQKGSVYVFERNQGGIDNWGQVIKLVASDGYMYERFGYSVDINDDHVIVGAPAHNGGAYMGGAAYVFSRNHGGADTWGEVAKLMAADVANYDQFGWSVGIDQGLVVIGSNKGDGLVADSGSAYLYAKNQGGADAWGVVTELNASDGVAFDYFGESVAVAGDWVVVGAQGDESSTGAVYLYGRNQGGADGWGEIKKITASDGESTDQFGGSVSIHISNVLVGAPYADAAYLYRRNHGGIDNWGEAAILTASDGQAFDRFGYAVSLDAEFAAVGATKGSGVVAESGAVYLYQRNIGGADNWGEAIKLQAADGAEDDAFGHSVAISGHRLWCGAPYDDDVTASSGAVYRFDLQVVPPEADLSITVDDGSTSAVPGTTTTYTIEVGNAGPLDVSGASVTDDFPTGLACNWTCVATGAASCTAGPQAGNIDDLVDLPVGETLTYTALCAIDQGATGSISNTAAVGSPAGIDDPNPANDSDTDVDTLAAEADLNITLDNGTDLVVLGDLVTYSIVVSNPGPSQVPGATVSDVFQADLIGVVWSCVGSNGGSCNASGSGDIAELVDLPVGATVIFTATGTCDPGATAPSLVNTATVTSPVSVTELNPSDNTATDDDVVVRPEDIIFSDGFESGNTNAW